MLTSINRRQRLYVFSAGRGYSCFGFDNAHERATKLLQWLQQELILPMDPIRARKGTRAHWQHCEAVTKAAGEYCARTGKRCPVELTPQLLGLEGKRVEVVDKHGETRRFIVGKSTGWLPIHLEVANRRSSGGGRAAGAPYKSVRVLYQAR